MKVVHLRNTSLRRVIFKSESPIKSPLKRLRPSELASLLLAQALYQSLGFPLPTEPAKDHPPVLIYGGSTATGTLAIQFAKL